jgi:hypothetical protein
MSKLLFAGAAFIAAPLVDNIDAIAKSITMIHASPVCAARINEVSANKPPCISAVFNRDQLEELAMGDID